MSTETHPQTPVPATATRRALTRTPTIALVGDVGRLTGDASGLQGDASGLQGDASGLQGDVSGLRGTVSGLRGDVDACGLTSEDRERGVDVEELVQA